MAFLAAAALLAAFFGNVVYGALSGTPIVGNVAEMLVLFGASIAFVVGILGREARDKPDRS
ncbi:MAG: hypothetical protein AAGI51_13800 [Pseudomonadota bacterium]